MCRVLVAFVSPSLNFLPPVTIFKIWSYAWITSHSHGQLQVFLVFSAQNKWYQAHYRR